MMQNCEEIQLDLAEYLSGDLSANQTEQITAHLNGCHTCRLALQFEKDLRAALGDIPLETCPAKVTDNLLEILEAETEANQRTPRWIWPLSGLAAAALAFLLILPGPFSPDAGSQSAEFTPTEIDAASNQAQLALAKVAQALNHNERTTLDKVFGEEIPTAMSATLLHLTRNLKGDT